MEKRIRKLIESFFDAPDYKKLDFLDNMLFDLLLHSEIAFFKTHGTVFNASLYKIFSYYLSKRKQIFRTHSKDKNKAFLPLNRIILLVTHDCQLRCLYCKINKFKSKIKKRVLCRASDLIFKHRATVPQIQFFGGEPLIHFNSIKTGVKCIENITRDDKKIPSFILTTNGINLTKEKVDFLKKHNFLIEFSIDGTPENHLKTKISNQGRQYYAKISKNFKYLKTNRLKHYSISVFLPENVNQMFKNFLFLVDMGFKKLQYNYSLGVYWPENKVNSWFEENQKIIDFVKKHKDIEFVNISYSRKEPVVLNSELTIDCDGDMYYEPGICLDTNFDDLKRNFYVNNIFKISNINEYGTTAFENFYKLIEVYGEKDIRKRKIILNNILLGIKYEKFLKNAK